MAEGGQAAAGLWARADLRNRWRSLVMLGVLAGVTAGIAMAAVAARRSDTALERLRAATNAPDAVVFSSQVGGYHPDWAPLRARPEVRAVAVWDLLFGSIDGEPGGLLFASHDGTYLGQVNRPIVVEGRMYDPTAPDEVVVSEELAKTVPVGTTVRFNTFAADQSDMTGEAPRGPALTMKVVGVVRLVNQFLFTPEQAFVSPGFAARYAGEVYLLENADVRLVHGAADMAALQRDVNELVAPGTPVLDLHAVSRRVDTTLSVERTALLVLGAAVALAGGLLVAQALIRSAGVVGDDALVLRAIGMLRRDLVAASVLAHLVTAVVAMAVAGIAAVLASRFFPVGLGRRIDADVGVHADWTVLVPGMLATGALTVAGVALVAWRATRLAVRAATQRPSSLIAAVRRRAPAAVGIGTSMAFERGRGRSSVPVVPAVLGAMVGVLGVVATLTINDGINDSLAHPERAGVTWDATALMELGAYEPSGLRPEAVDQVLADAPPGSSAVVIDRQVLDVDGVGVPTFSLRTPRGDDPIALSITSGAAPRGVGEAAIGPETARVLGVRVGDTVTLAGAAPVRLVGYGLFPSDVHAEFDEGLWVTPEQMEQVSPSPADGPAFEGDRYLALRFPDHVDAGDEINRMAQTLGPPVSGITPAEVPAELDNLRDVRKLPVLLATFLALIAVAAVSHVLATSARRRRHDFAILRALGLSGRGARLVLASQGTAIGLVGLLIGVPLGIAVGRAGWHVVAERVPIEAVPPLALIAVLLIVPATVVIVNALALWPGRGVAKMKPGNVLRTE